MKRDHIIEKLQNETQWDMIIIGGGASGLGAALDAVSRGYKTLLLEQGDFAQATSSRSTKLVHGGVRYLRQGRISLVREALHERELLLRNAPHLVHPLPFLLPTTNVFSKYFYYTGIKLYDILASKSGFGRSCMMSNQQMRQRLPTISQGQFSGGICYFDGQFDDARLAINLAQTIHEHGGLAINYMQVTQLLKENGKVTGVIVRDVEEDKNYQIQGKVVINATGIFVDALRLLDDSKATTLVVPSQGTHIVLERSFFPGDCALIIPETSDGRVLFAVPWQNRVIVGTTDTELNHISLEPRPIKSEISYLLETIGKYLTKQPVEADILSMFSGLRPLVKPQGEWKDTATLSRDYVINVSSSQLITVTGGKWTTYRKMGEETVEKAAHVAGLPVKPSQTKHLHIHGWKEIIPSQDEWQYYGADQPLVEQLANENSQLRDKLHPDIPCRGIDIIWGARHEMARRLEDVLSRRTRSLLLGARASLEIAPKAAAILAKELGKDKEWENSQVHDFRYLAEGYFT